MSNKQAIINAYKASESIKHAARAGGTSEDKARKILLTAGVLIPSPHTRAILDAHNSGMSIRDISKQFGITDRAVNAHLPYIRCQYGVDDPTPNAANIRTWREKTKSKEKPDEKSD